MADVSDSDKSPRRDTVLPKTNMKGDGSARRAEIPAMYRLESSDGPSNVLIACNLNGDNHLTWSREVAVFLVKGGGGPNNVGKQQQKSFEARLVCEHCGKLGHTNNNCWALNGYPAWYTAKRSKGKKPIGQGRRDRTESMEARLAASEDSNPQGPDRATVRPLIGRGLIAWRPCLMINFRNC
ncbi:hypothetical protein NL676_014090 [Syzygium grande]|nr:hypothetical protein NL676_014090 [Syzygium grande]